MKHPRRFLVAAVLCAAPAVTLGVELTISCGAVGIEGELCQQATAAWARQTGHSVTIDVPPQATDQRYFKYLIDLNNADSGVDVYQIDVIWPGLLASHLVDLNEYIPAEDVQQHHPAIVANNTVDGRLVGMPWFTDLGLLYYRKDLLEKYQQALPQTWAELGEVAARIQAEERDAGNEELWGYVFQGDNYEGLTCNALEWISAHGGGTFVDAEGNITVDNPDAARALSQVADWVGRIAPPRVTRYIEEDARITFQRGNAVFMRNWPYAWYLLNADDSPVKDQVGVAPLPQGGDSGRSASTLGGWQLAVSKYSEHPEEAADLVRYLTSAAVQKSRAVKGSYAPTIMALYEDPQILAANPFFESLPPILENAVARPSAVTGQNYMAVTTHIWETVHDVLRGDIAADIGLDRLQDRLRLVRTRGRW
ncbi:MAG: ABC transporter substrate-binding protein [Candidatus Competibacterales bacterium]|nr:ABC transporter substrate-binding protein [Candidatus Competibacterales bacterium]